jgi:probable rRNA maturation factor
MKATAEALSPDLAIQREAEGEDLPDDEDIRRFAAAALAGLENPVLSLRIVDEAEGRALNRRWRERDYATNVLSFPADLPPGTGINFLGDLAICAPVVVREAAEQGKPVEAHFAHLLIHGILHLRGFDHISAEQAERMESREIELLAGLGFGNPYEHDDH